jgi:hypothetical protein
MEHLSAVQLARPYNNYYHYQMAMSNDAQNNLLAQKQVFCRYLLEFTVKKCVTAAGLSHGCRRPAAFGPSGRDLAAFWHIRVICLNFNMFLLTENLLLKVHHYPELCYNAL